MTEITKNEWLIEEYRQLSQHYFHEDNFYIKTNTVFMTINAAMIAFLGSDHSKGINNDSFLLFSVIGFVSVIAWSLSLLRTRFCRVRVENRIEELEKFIQDNFTENDILKLRKNNTPTPWYAQIPSSVIMLILPVVFGSIWGYYLYILTVK